MSIVESIFDVFGAIGTWFVETIPQFYVLFWNAETGLTLLGTMAVVSVGVGIAFLCLGLIQRFIGFRAN